MLRPIPLRWIEEAEARQVRMLALCNRASMPAGARAGHHRLGVARAGKRLARAGQPAGNPDPVVVSAGDRDRLNPAG